MRLFKYVWPFGGHQALKGWKSFIAKLNIKNLDACVAVYKQNDKKDKGK